MVNCSDGHYNLPKFSLPGSITLAPSHFRLKVVWKTSREHTSKYIRMFSVHAESLVFNNEGRIGEGGTWVKMMYGAFSGST